MIGALSSDLIDRVTGTLNDMTEPTGAERYLARRLEDPEYRQAYEEAEPSEPDVPTQGPVADPTLGRPPAQTRHSTPPVVHQAWVIDGGSIVFEIRPDKPLPASAFATVGEVVASLEHLAETLAPVAPQGLRPCVT